MNDRFGHEITVHELGEDSNSWLVTGLLGYAEKHEDVDTDARAAIDEWFVATVGDDPDTLAECRANLATAKPRTGTWWFATGHAEGELVDYHKAHPPKTMFGVVYR